MSHICVAGRLHVALYLRPFADNIPFLVQIPTSLHTESLYNRLSIKNQQESFCFLSVMSHICVAGRLHVALHLRPFADNIPFLVQIPTSLHTESLHNRL
jgi:hypothetical protein